MEIITLCIFYIQRPDLQLLGRITRLCLLADHKNALDNSCLHVGINSPLVSQLCNFITSFKANFMSYSFTKLIVNLKVVTRSLGNIILRLLIPLQLIASSFSFPSKNTTRRIFKNSAAQTNPLQTKNTDWRDIFTSRLLRTWSHHFRISSSKADQQIPERPKMAVKTVLPRSPCSRGCMSRSTLVCVA